MRVTCKHCGGPHPAFECRKKSGGNRAAEPAATPDRSTAAREADVLGRQETASLALKHSKRSKAVSNGRISALPVDTNSSGEAHPPMVREMDVPAFTTSLAGAEGNKDRQPKFDKKAWMREYMREYMRQRRQSIKSGTRIPKERGK